MDYNQIKGRILFLTDFYYPKPLPNGICLHRVALEMIQTGWEVHVVCYRRHGTESIEEYEKVKIHYINMRLFYKLRTYAEDNQHSFTGKLAIAIARPMNKLAKLILLPWFPMASPTTINRFYRKTEKLHELHKFDAVISLFNPEDTLFAGIRLKKKYPALKLGAYILDSLIFLAGKKKLPSIIRDKLSWRFEKLIYENFDVVYNMETHRIHHDLQRYDKYRHKMKFLDIPLFTPRQLKLIQRIYDPRKKHLVYMGTLFKSFRNPDYIYRLFKNINDNDAYRLHFYTRGECEGMLINYEQESYGAILRHGYVEHSKIENIYANANFLINLGVSNSTNISSKIFDYMSTGKPIIHFYYLDDDVNIPYLQKYDQAIFIKMDDNSFDKNVTLLKLFLDKGESEAIDSTRLIDKFKKNLPEYTASKFSELAKKRNPDIVEKKIMDSILN